MDVLFLVCLCVIFDRQVAACPQGCDCSNIVVWCNGRRLITFPELQTIPVIAEDLYFNDNTITDIRLSCKNAIQVRFVTKLDLTSNLLTVIPVYENSILSGFTELKILNLQENRINHIDNDAFSGLYRLKWLYLAHNHVTKVMSSWFDKLSSLMHLHLDNNLISSFDPDNNFTWPGKLRRLNLNNNRISTIPPLPIKACNKTLKWCTRTKVYLTPGNDIYCGCRRPEHDKTIANLTLLDIYVCCVDISRKCHKDSKLHLHNHVERPICVKPSIEINFNNKGTDVCVVKGEPKPEINVSINCIMEYRSQDNQEEITNMMMVKCEAENVFGKEMQKIQFDGYKYCQPQILPLGAMVIFCFLSFIPAIIILGFIIDNLTKKEVIQDEDDDMLNISN